MTDSKKLNVTIDKDRRNILHSLLRLVIARPFEVFNGLEYGMDTLTATFNKLGLNMKQNFSMYNKNPMLPYCEFQSQIMGMDIGYETPMCSQFKYQYTDKGFCYSFNTGFNNENVHGAKVGLVNSFTFTIDANLLEVISGGNFVPGGNMPLRYIHDKTLTTSNVYLSNQDASPPTREGPESIPVSVASVHSLQDFRSDNEKIIRVFDVVITASKVKTAEDTRNFSPERRGCQFASEQSDLELFDTFTQENCYLECKMKIVALECGCVPWNYPALSNSELCSPMGNVCFEKAMKVVSKKETFESCGCLPSCNRIEYDYEIAGDRQLSLVQGTEINDYLYVKNITVDFVEVYTGRLADYIEDSAFKLWDEFVSYFKFESSRDGSARFTHLKKRITSDSVLVNVYFKTPTALTIERRSSITLSSVLGNVGGTLGLFMGVSIISIGEIFSFVFELLFNKCN